MPNLSRKAVHKFWHDYDRKTLYRILTSMEGLEDWVLDDDPRINELLDELGEVIEERNSADVKNQTMLIKIFANIHSSRALRLMQFLDTIKPGTASKLLVHAEEQTKDTEHKNWYADLFLKRNMVFEKMQLLGRIFSQERVNLIIRALENAE